MTRAGGAHVDVDDVVLRRWFFIHLFALEQLQTNVNFDISEFFSNYFEKPIGLQNKL